MLSLTKRTEYALIAACHLARSDADVVNARDIAEQYSIRLPLLMSVLKQLNRAGVLASVRGARGGYRLAVEATELSLARVIEEIEGQTRLVRCATPGDDHHPGECELLATCPLRLPLGRVHNYFRTMLGRVTIADLAFDDNFDAGAPKPATLKVKAL